MPPIRPSTPQTASSPHPGRLRLTSRDKPLRHDVSAAIYFSSIFMKSLIEGHNSMLTDFRYFPHEDLVQTVRMLFDSGLSNAITMFAARRMGKTQRCATSCCPPPRPGAGTPAISICGYDRTSPSWPWSRNWGDQCGSRASFAGSSPTASRPGSAMPVPESKRSGRAFPLPMILHTGCDRHAPARVLG